METFNDFQPKSFNMKASEKLKARLKHGNVWVRHTTETDPEGDPNIIQVPKGSLQDYLDQGYVLVKSDEINPAEKPAAVKSVEPQGTAEKPAAANIENAAKAANDANTKHNRR